MLRSDAIRAGLLTYAQALDKNALTEQTTLSRPSLDALVEDDVFRNLLIERREMVARVLARNREVSRLIDGLYALVQQELAS